MTIFRASYTFPNICIKIETLIEQKIANQINKLRILYRRAIEKKRYSIKKNCNSVWYGNTYGGFFVNPDLLDEDSIVYSIGVGCDVSFDMEIIKQHNSCVYGFDPTPKSINWVSRNTLPDRFKFSDFGIGKKTGIENFHLPKNPDYVSGSIFQHANVREFDTVKVKMKSFQDITWELGHKKIDILKMDIEGSEYDVIDSILNSDVRIDQILIEFHERFFDDGFQKTMDAIKKIDKKGYKLFGIPESKEELSFILDLE